MLHNRQFPVIGGRILKSSIATVLCILVYALRTRLPIGNGIPFYSVLAALWCMQPYPSQYPGYTYLRIMGIHATKQAMLRRLQEIMQIQKTVTFGSIPGAYDVYIGNGGGDATVKKLKKTQPY